MNLPLPNPVSHRGVAIFVSMFLVSLMATTARAAAEIKRSTGRGKYILMSENSTSEELLRSASVDVYRDGITVGQHRATLIEVHTRQARLAARE
jgi:hypothetical protein